MISALALLTTIFGAAPCTTPKDAVTHWLTHVEDPATAGTCAFPPEGMSGDEVVRAVGQLKEVLDARGVHIQVEDLPDDPAFHDPVLGQPRLVIAAELPEIVFVGKQGRWGLASSSLRAAQALHTRTFGVDLRGWSGPWPAWLGVRVFGLAAWQLLGFVGLVLLGLIVRVIVAHLVTTQVLHVFDRLEVEWGREQIRSNALPLGTLALAGVVALGIPTLLLEARWSKVALMGTRIVGAVSLVMLVYRFVDIVSAYLAHRAAGTESKLDDQLVPLIRRGLRIMTILGGVVFVLQNMEVNVGSLVATLGIGSLAFALAAQDTVKNLFGSITIFTDKPFQIGDWVVTNGVEGVIHEVGFRSTQIRTFYDSIVTVPNGRFTEAIVDNFGRRRYRRTSTKLGLTYDTTPEQIEAFCEGIRALILAHEKTRKDAFEVHFSGYGDFALEIMVYFFFEVGGWSEELRARHEIYLDIWRLAQELGVGFAFPTRTLHIETQSPPKERPSSLRPSFESLVASVESFGPGGSRSIPAGPRLGVAFRPARRKTIQNGSHE